MVAEQHSLSSETSERLGLIVGIGASAGGLRAFTAFLKEFPRNNGMAFVLVQHLSPDHASTLAELLARATTMPVVEATDGASVEPSHVYVIPPNATLTIQNRILSVTRPVPPEARHRLIDIFFASLAEDQGENAVCVVLSGTGSDGTLGLKAIKENGGFALAQAASDHTAMSGMPHSAAATGLVDEVLPVEAMAKKLLAYERHLGAVSSRKGPDGARKDMAEQISAVQTLLRNKIGHDFSGYKNSTVARRIQRRMQVLQIGEVSEYIARLMEDPVQVNLLFNDLLIGVTQFFRDPDAFTFLEREIIPKLLDTKGAGDQVRIWVPGCATGEEVYSIGLLMAEALERRLVRPGVQIFGTDIDSSAINAARAGQYRKTVGVSPGRLARWFTEDGDNHRPVKDIREMCVFSVHSVIKDAPFSRLDLISCRNLLIYLNPELQTRVLRTFHYALRPDGILFLGPSEGATRFGKFFAKLDKKHRVFQRKGGEQPEQALFLTPPSRNIALSSSLQPAISEDRIDKAVRRLLEKHSPAYVVVNEREEIVRFSGSESGHFIEMPSGAASLNLFSLLKKPLQPVVRRALRAASNGGDRPPNESVVLCIDGKILPVSVIVAQIAENRTGPKLYVVAFSTSGKSVPDVAEAAVAGGVRTPRSRRWKMNCAPRRCNCNRRLANSRRPTRN